MFNDPLIDGCENQEDFENEIQAEADSGLPQLTPEQISRLTNNPQIQATVEANKAKAPAKRASDLMLLGYNQALLDYGQLPECWATQDMIRTINDQKAKLGIE